MLSVKAKIQTMIRFLFISFFSLLLISPNISAQQWFKKPKHQKGYKGAPFQSHNSISFGAGSSHYFYSNNDLNYLSNWINSKTSFNFGASFTRHFNKHFSYRFSGDIIQIKGNPLTFTQIPTNASLKNIVFSTSNNIVAISYKGLYEILGNDEYVLKRPLFKPFVSIGISVFSNNPSVERVDVLGYSGVIKSIPFTQKYALEPTISNPTPGLSTFSETITNPSEIIPSIGVAIPISTGFRYRINETIDIGFELGYFTNLIPSIFPQSVGTNTTKVLNPQLLIPAKRPYTTDHVVTSQLQLIFHIPSPKECPPLPR